MGYMKNTRLLLLALLAMAFPGNGPAKSLPLENGDLRVSFDDHTGRFDLRDGCGSWQSEPSQYAVRVVSSSEGNVRLEITTKDGPVMAIWSLLDGGGMELCLSAPPDRKMTEPLNYPPAWKTREGDRGIHPMGEGLAYDVNDPVFRPKPTGYPFRRAHDVTMGFYGIEREGRYLMHGLGEALFAEYCVTTGFPRRAHVRWMPDDGKWGKDRVVRFFPAKTLGAAARRYRNWRETISHVSTLAERAATNPRIKLLSGAADFWVWDDNAQNRLYNWPLVKESAPRDVRRIAGEMKARGMDHVLWCGFDNETPEDCAFLTELGYLVGTYDCFRDVYHKGLLEYTDPRNFVRGARFLPFAEDVTCIKEDGSFDTAWTIPDKTGKLHDMYGLCDACGPELARKLIAPDVKRIGYSARLMDVQIAEGPHPCWSKRHPATLRQALEAQRVEHRYLQNELKLVVGTEIGSENHIGCFDYSEGAMSKPMVSRDFGWRYKDCAFFGADVPEGVKTIALNPKTRVPLWELVYHDCAVSYYHWMDTNMIYPEHCLWRDLFCVLYGLPPIYSMRVEFWDKLKDQVAASYRRVSPVARQTTFARMTDFEYLSPDRLVQRTRFDNGLSVVVNFSNEQRHLPDGGRIGPESYRTFTCTSINNNPKGKETR